MTEEYLRMIKDAENMIGKFKDTWQEKLYDEQIEYENEEDKKESEYEESIRKAIMLFFDEILEYLRGIGEI